MNESKIQWALGFIEGISYAMPEHIQSEIREALDVIDRELAVKEEPIAQEDNL